jgi:hypothetical protein
MKGRIRVRDERGFAVVTALLVSMAVLALSLVAAGLAIHNLDSSSYDRKRLQSVDVAEAGVDLFSSVLAAQAWASMPCPTTPGASGDAGANMFGDLPTSPTAHYQVYVGFYSTWPPATTADITCTQVRSGTVPAAAVIRSVGTAVKPDTGRPVSRTIESMVRMTPIFGSLGMAVFSDTLLTFQNSLTLNGSSGNNADVYTNGDFTLANNTTIGGTVYAQGSATIGQGIVKVDVWSGGNVNLSSGISINGNAIAAGVKSGTTGSMTLNNATIYGDAKAKGAITMNNSVINGAKISGAAGLTGPPAQTLPLICWPGCPGDNPTNATQLYYACQGAPDQSYCGPVQFIERDYTGSSACTTAKNDIGNWFGETSNYNSYVLVINEACALSWPNNSTVSIRGNLAIFSFGGTTGCTNGSVSNGAICTINNVTFNSVGGTWDMEFIRPYQSGLNCSTHNYDIDVSNSTQLNSLKTFIYSQCTVNFGNNNASGVNTQLVGGTVNLTNQMVLNFNPTLAPLTRITGYRLGPVYLREVAS